jgi:hypothetical protein
MLPVFSQNNKVFAPDPPGGKQQLWVRYHMKGVDLGWMKWYNDGQEYLNKTYTNRFSIASYENRVHEYVLGQLYNAHELGVRHCEEAQRSNLNKDSLLNNYFLNDKACIMATRYFSDNAVGLDCIAIDDALQYKVLFICPEEFSGKPLSEIKADTTVFNFPEMKLVPSATCLK